MLPSRIFSLNDTDPQEGTETNGCVLGRWVDGCLNDTDPQEGTETVEGNPPRPPASVLTTPTRKRVLKRFAADRWSSSILSLNDTDPQEGTETRSCWPSKSRAASS